MSLTLDEEIKRRKLELDANFETAKQLGTAHLDRLSSEIRALGLHRGSYIIVKVETGEYVTGPTRQEARLAFKALHGKALAWVTRVEDLPLA